MARRITLTVAADGSVVATSSGEPGPGCLNDLAIIESLCDTAVVSDSRLTSEYHATATRRQDDLSHIVNLDTETER